MENRLLELIQKQKGMITTQQAKKAGFSSIYLTNLVRKGLIERVYKGVYLDVNAFGDEYYLFQVKHSKAIFCHNTALYFHHFSERTPGKMDVCVYRGYNPHMFPSHVKVHYVSKQNYKLGLERMISPQGQEVMCYNLERTICDLIKNNTSLDNETRNKSLRLIFKSGQINEHVLLDYAVQLKCKYKINMFIELLE